MSALKKARSRIRCRWFQSLLTTYDVDTVFLCLIGTDELFTVLNCIDAISRAGTVKQLICLSVIGDFTSDAGLRAAIQHRPDLHLYAKVLVEQRLQHGSFPFEWTVLGPPFFFTNDEMQKHNLLNNSYLGSPLYKVGVNMASISNIALAARNLMYDTSGNWNHKKIQIGSKRTYTGTEVKDIWSRALDKPLEGFFAT